MAQTLTTLQLEPFASELECDEKECFSLGRDKDKHREYNMKHKQRASLPENATHTYKTRHVCVYCYVGACMVKKTREHLK